MTYNGKEYILINEDVEEAPCMHCALLDLCEKTADDLNIIDFELCATEENFEYFENPYYIRKI